MFLRRLLPVMLLIGVGLALFRWGDALASDAKAPERPAADFRYLTPISQLGGGVFAVAGTEDRAYVAQGLRIQTYDITQPEHPALLGQSAPVIGDMERLVIEGDRLYAFASGGNPNQDRLLVFDIAHTPPVLLGDILLPGEPRIVQDHILYLFLDEGREVRFWDVSRLDHVRDVGGYRDAWPASGAVLVGRRLFLYKTPIDLSTDDIADRVVALDVSDFGRPTILAVYPLTWWDGFQAGPLWADEERLFVPVREDTVVLDVTDPHQLREIGRIQQLPRSKILKVEGNTLYLGAAGRLITYDIEDFQQPQIIQQMDMPGIGDFALAGSNILGWQRDGWALVRAPAADQLALAASLPAQIAHPLDLFVQDGFVYLTEAKAFDIIDVRQPKTPRLVYRYALDYELDPYTYETWPVFVLGNRAYVGVKNHLFIFDVTHPAQAALIKALETPYGVEDIDGLVDRIYLAGYHMVAMDPQGEELVTLEGTVGRPIQVRQIDGRRFLYTGYTDAISLIIYDISDESHPERLASVCPRDCRIDRNDWNLDVEGGLAFLSNGSIYNVQDPAHVEKISRFEPVWGRVDVAGDNVFYANDYLYWVDATQPEDVKVQGVSLSHLTRDGSWGLVQNEGDIVYAAGENGLQLFRPFLATTPTPTPTPPRLPTPTPTPTPAPPQQLRFLGQTGGVPWGQPSTLAVVEDETLYIAQGNALRIMDISDPRTFRELGHMENLPAPLTSLAVQEGFLYAQAGGLLTIDVRDPGHPRITDDQPGIPGDVRATQNRVYLVASDAWTAFDITQPEHPQLVDRIPPMEGGFSFHGANVVIGLNNLLTVYDLSVPSQPERIGELIFDQAIHITQMAYDHPYLIMETFNENEYDYRDQYAFVSVDMTDPTHPRIVNQTRASWISGISGCQPHGASQTPASPEADSWYRTIYHHLMLRYPYLYYAYRSEGFTTDYFMYYEYEGLGHWDVSPWFSGMTTLCAPPEGEREANRIDGVALPLAASDTRLIAAYRNDLAIFQVEPFVRLPMEPNADRYMGLLTPIHVDGWDTTLYVTTHDHVLALDNAQPQRPQVLGPLYPAAVAARFEGPWAYLTYQNPFGIPYTLDVWAMNVTDPLAARHPLTPREDMMMDEVIAVSQGLVLLKHWSPDRAYEFYGKVIDARDPERPQDLSQTYGFGPIDLETLTPWETDPLVAWTLNPTPYDHILRISRASAPDQPVAELRLPVDRPIGMTALRGRTLYLLTDSDLRLIDFTNLDHPQTIARYDFTNVWGQAHALKLYGDRAYIAIGPQVRIVDVHDPDHLTEVGRYDAPGDVMDLHLHGHILTLAMGRLGFIQLDDVRRFPHALYLPLIGP